MIFAVSSLAAGDASVTFLSGSAEIKKKSGETVPARLRMPLDFGDEIKTADNSTMEISLDESVKIRVSAASLFRLSSQNKNARTSENKFSLEYGKVWSSVNRLRKNKNFEIETPVAIAGVRGTIFAVKADESGTTVYVGAGQVGFLSKALGKEVVLDKSYTVRIDSEGKFSESRRMNEQDKKEMMSGVPVFFQKSDSDEAYNLSQKIGAERDALNASRRTAQNLKENDLGAGRTLRDLHGNIVRVEQIFRKNAANSFQLINLSKRDSGIDFFDITIFMNKNLPDNLGDWGQFLINEKNLNITSRKVLAGAKRKSGTDDLITWSGNYNSSSKEFEESFIINGSETLTPAHKTLPVFKLGSGNEFISESEIPLYRPNGQLACKLRVSMYVINNDGNILSQKILASNSDVLQLLSTAAGEIILSSDAMMAGSIDVVIVPDIAFVVINEIF